MVVSYSRYQLKNHSTVREGALLRIEFPDGSIGYSDCHPWIERGDLALDAQLELLSQKKTTPLTERSLFFANIDAMARARKQSAFEDLPQPNNHWLISNIGSLQQSELDQAIKLGFTCFKIKMADEIDLLTNLLDRLPSNSLFRLDFNQRISETTFRGLLPKILKLTQNIDFFEDPFEFELASWKAIQEEFSIRLAADLHSHLAIGYPEAAKVLVVKPAIQDEALFLDSISPQQQLVITSYLDHPIGQLSAAYAAGICLEKNPNVLTACGLVSHWNYQENAFSKELVTDQTRLQPPVGTGFGFDQLLTQLNWKIARYD